MKTILKILLLILISNTAYGDLSACMSSCGNKTNCYYTEIGRACFPKIVHGECFCNTQELSEKIQEYNQICEVIDVACGFKPIGCKERVCIWVKN